MADPSKLRPIESMKGSWKFLPNDALEGVLRLDEQPADEAGHRAVEGSLSDGRRVFGSFEPQGGFFVLVTRVAMAGVGDDLRFGITGRFVLMVGKGVRPANSGRAQALIGNAYRAATGTEAIAWTRTPFRADRTRLDR
ncbi:MAG TPA: hypothetical protein VGW40_02010 [Allosphingosinicella sp.]|nr:hypothetical protein [Allosphingosinicella sp.]